MDGRADADGPWLVVGLGNPGPGYAGNRHNVGQQLVQKLADEAGARFSSHRANAVVASVPAEGLTLAKPNTYMNLSGAPVAALLRFFGIPVGRMIVVHDELDLPFDRLRLKFGGGHGGHNGLRDIIATTGDPDFVRTRIGIGRPEGRQPAADFVLRDFTADERKLLPVLLEDAADAVRMIAAEGLTAAQLKFHTAT